MATIAAHPLWIPTAAMTCPPTANVISRRTKRDRGRTNWADQSPKRVASIKRGVNDRYVHALYIPCHDGEILNDRGDEKSEPAAEHH